MYHFICSIICVFGEVASSSFSRPQVAEAKTGREASRASGGSRAHPQVGAGGTARATREGPAVHHQ